MHATNNHISDKFDNDKKIQMAELLHFFKIYLIGKKRFPCILRNLIIQLLIYQLSGELIHSGGLLAGVLLFFHWNETVTETEKKN